MGFTIEDMMVISQDTYKMNMIAGQDGWSNSIKWIFLLEHPTILEHFTGKEMCVTTGLGFQTEEELLNLVDRLSRKHGSALVLNLGPYISEVPASVIDRCNEEKLPLLTIPWEISISDMIKDLTLYIFQQDRADEQISKALIQAIRQPDNRELYEEDLLPYFDVDGSFQTILISNGSLDSMDTVERNRLSYQLQIYLEKITHNGNFFYYDSYFVMVVNDVLDWELDQIVDSFLKNVKKKMPGEKIYIGVGSQVQDISRLRLSYKRACSAISMAYSKGLDKPVYFDRMGISRLFFSITDSQLIEEMGAGLLEPIIAYDSSHGTDYVQTLSLFLQYNGSIQAVAREMYTHRNTVIYHMNNIKKLLDTELDTPQERLPYLIACLLYRR